MTFARALRHRSFALLWTGQTISRLGDSLYRIALSWWVLEKTGSAEAMGTVLVVSSIPMLIFLLVGGVVVDRLPRFRVLFGSDVLNGIVVGVVSLLAATGRLEVWHVYVAGAIFGFSEVTARIWSSVFGVVGVYATILIGGELFGRPPALLAGIVLATTFEYFVLSRLAIFDVVLAAFMLLAFYAFLKAIRTGARAGSGWETR